MTSKYDNFKKFAIRFVLFLIIFTSENVTENKRNAWVEKPICIPYISLVAEKIFAHANLEPLFILGKWPPNTAISLFRCRNLGLQLFF